MKLEGLSNNSFVNNNDNYKTLKNSSNQTNIDANKIFTDSTKINNLQKGIPNNLEQKNSLTSLGEKLVNQPILEHYLSYRNKNEYKSIVNKLDNLAINGANIYQLEAEAIKSSLENSSGSKALEKAYKSTLASVIHNKYSDKNFFNGEKDKVFHYFVSASMTTEIYNKIPLLPRNIKAEIAGGIVWTIGFLKEVASIPGNGYGKDDMQANSMGINRAKQYLKSIK
ncbi:MAG: hypothetical protein KatS3mg068_1709 [Candidatus Sericytochromatia bacterium]|nr:MAG: hypothetical protein KatS3mg068_1709 [Candidatus Sericytochromatia bacterium]